MVQGLGSASIPDFGSWPQLPDCTCADSTRLAAMPARREQHWTAGQRGGRRLFAVGTCRTDLKSDGAE